MADNKSVLKNIKVRDLRRFCKLQDRLACGRSDVGTNVQASLFTNEAVKKYGSKRKLDEGCRGMPEFDSVYLKRHLVHSTDTTFDKKSTRARKYLVFHVCGGTHK